MEILRNDLLSARFAYSVIDWSSVNWKKEPEQSFFDLCKLRAQQIRDTHDYIILYYSGGSDSYTILSAFLESGIFIDEIVISHFGINEQTHIAFEDIKLANNFGRLTENYISPSDVITFLKSDRMILDSPNFTGNLHSLSRFSVDWYEQNFNLPLVTRNGKVAHIFGVNDPSAFKKNGKWYSCLSIYGQFIPSFFHTHTKFFTSLDFPELHIKQCYMLARLIKYSSENSIDIKIKKFIRKRYNPIMSPKKPGASINSLLKMRKMPGETQEILDSYIYKSIEGFYDLYLKSVVKPSLNIDHDIKNISKQCSREYELGDIE